MDLFRNSGPWIYKMGLLKRPYLDIDDSNNEDYTIFVLSRVRGEKQGVTRHIYVKLWRSECCHIPKVWSRRQGKQLINCGQYTYQTLGNSVQSLKKRI